ncbi:MAG TPA: metal-dependent hydrolase [Acidimicrobiales bacterium]|nr:metal-dependent hydrolase [Acidimicrobiales bacterium]
MSWAAHELESYFLQKHIKAKVSYLAVLLGCLLPDFFTKLPVYGLHIGNLTYLKASFPAKYHRGWPGVGFTHSLAFGVVVAIVVLWRTKNRAWALGLMIGVFAHVLTDTFDSVGTMLFFPFTTQHYSTDMWAYAAQQGRYGDAAAYYSSLGGVWDFFWLLMAVSGFRVFSREYFFSTVVPNDSVWDWMRNRFDMSERAMVAVYRAYFVYGGCRIFAWFLWARLIDHAPLDWSWGGPYWVQKVSFPAANWGVWFENTGRGLAGMAAALALLWIFVGRRLWEQAA